MTLCIIKVIGRSTILYIIVEPITPLAHYHDIGGMSYPDQETAEAENATAINKGG